MYKADWRDRGDDVSVLDFLLSQLFGEVYIKKCNSCRYYRNGECTSRYPCSYEKKEDHRVRQSSDFSLLFQLL